MSNSEITQAASVLKRADELLRDGDHAVLATLSHIIGSSSQPLSTRMVIAADGSFTGAVSGGCVEGDIRRVAALVLADRRPRLQHYRKVEDPILEVGLNCEGQIDVLLEPLTEEILAPLTGSNTPAARSVPTAGSDPGSRAPGTGAAPGGAILLIRYSAGKPDDPAPVRALSSWPPDSGAIATALGGPAAMGAPPGPPPSGDAHISSAPPGSAPAAIAVFEPALLAGLTDSLRSTEAPVSVRSATGEVLYAEPLLPPPLLAIFSAADIARPLTRLAKVMGFRVIISDPRENYAVRERFPVADEVYCGWPSELPMHEAFGSRAYVVSLNHEPRFEDDLFRMLMGKPRVAYIGAIGKAKRQTERLERQHREGYDLSQLPQVHTPVGLKLGGKGPEAIALSIIAEIQSVRFRPIR